MPLGRFAAPGNTGGLVHVPGSGRSVFIHPVTGAEFATIGQLQAYSKWLAAYNKRGPLALSAPRSVTPFNDGQMLQLTKKYSRISQTDGVRADRYLAAKRQQGFITEEQAKLISAIRGMPFIEKGPGTQMHHLFPVVMGSKIPRSASSPFLYSAAAWEHSILHTALDHHFSNLSYARSITVDGKTATRTLQSAQYHQGKRTVTANWTRSERIAILDNFYVNFADGAYLLPYLKERLITLAKGID